MKTIIKMRIDCEDGFLDTFGHMTLTKEMQDELPKCVSIIDGGEISSTEYESPDVLIIRTYNCFSVRSEQAITYHIEETIPNLFKKGYKLDHCSFYSYKVDFLTKIFHRHKYNIRVEFAKRMKELMKEG